MSTKYTPGPWMAEIFENGLGRPSAIIRPRWRAHDHLQIAASIPSDCGGVNQPAELIANANLIAAAPDLLCSLKQMVAIVQESKWPTSVAKALDAIRKAEGWS